MAKHKLLFSSYSTLYLKEQPKTLGCLLAAIYIKRVILLEVTISRQFASLHTITFNVLKRVPVYFSCLEEYLNAV